ncbi:unnamed protein product, partial [Ceratitis capitata]
PDLHSTSTHIFEKSISSTEDSVSVVINFLVDFDFSQDIIKEERICSLKRATTAPKARGSKYKVKYSQSSSRRRTSYDSNSFTPVGRRKAATKAEKNEGLVKQAIRRGEAAKPTSINRRVCTAIISKQPERREEAEQ